VKPLALRVAAALWMIGAGAGLSVGLEFEEQAPVGFGLFFIGLSLAFIFA
jgi:hypothetical protein